MTPDRGGLQVIPRPHIGEIFRYRRTAGGSYLEIADDVLPLSAVITFSLRAGGALLLTNKAPHRSTDNVTDVIRRIPDVRYQSVAPPCGVRKPDSAPSQVSR